MSNNRSAVGLKIEDHIINVDWSFEDLEYVLKWDSSHLIDILSGHKNLTTDNAIDLQEATGIDSRIWIACQQKEDLANAKSDKNIIERAKFQNMLPIREMINRGWIRGQCLERELCVFFQVDTLRELLELLLGQEFDNEEGNG